MTVSDQPVGAFLDAVAGGGVTPGGGATAAVAGAAGAALLEMVCANTLDRTDERAEDLATCQADLGGHRERLLTLADEDVTAVEALMDAYGTPDGDGRQEAIQTASVQATEVPLEIAEVCRDVLDVATTVVELGNPNAVADGVIGATLIHGALEAMVYTVSVNLEAIDDDAVVEDLAARADVARREGETALERIRKDRSVRG